LHCDGSVDGVTRARGDQQSDNAPDRISQHFSYFLFSYKWDLDRAEYFTA